MAWTKPGDLVDKLCARVCTKVTQAISNGHLSDARSTLKVIRKLPSNTRIPDNHFFEVVTAARDFTIQAIRNRNLRSAKLALKVIRKLPPNTRIPDGFFPPLQAG